MKKQVLNYHNSKIIETSFNLENQGKIETIFSLGNSYLGLRSVTEENNLYRHYGLFIGGTFNTPPGPEVPELPNGADILNMEFKINGINFNLSQGKITNYQRSFDYQKAILTRKLVWNYQNYQISFQFETFLSWDNVHLLAQKVKVSSLKGDIDLDFISGIDGNPSNSGVNHFEDSDTQFHQNVQQYRFQTTQSKINFFYSRTYEFKVNDVKLDKVKNSLLSVYGYDRKKVYQEFNFELKQNELLEITSFSLINTSIDFDFQQSDDYLKNQLIMMKTIQMQGYDFLKKHHLLAYQKELQNFGLKIQTKNQQDQTIIQAAIYHMLKFTPRFDHRLNIDAKAWTGEEYKGHTFWDTEIYILPFYIYTNPERAKALLTHRYFVKPSAHLKAKANNLTGAMWPWETSWFNDGETCPVWGEVDFKTGQRMKVWAGINELHISADIMWAIWLYYNQTHDQEFMNQYGYEMLLDTAIFWVHQVSKNNQGQYEILNVTGPNEYKENINNNYFTNFMVKEMLGFSLEVIHELKTNKQNLFDKLNQKIGINKFVEQIDDVYQNLFLPEWVEGIIPENDTFLSLKQLPKMSFYQANKSQLWKEYTSNDLNQYQLLKQADIIALFYTLGHKFNKETILKNWDYYESRTLHSSSLSHSMHATIAAKIGETNLANEFFKKALNVDFNPENMFSSTNGIHAAATGGIIKAIVEGFGGLENRQELTLNPHLTDEIKSLEFHFFYHDQKYLVQINHQKLIIINLSGQKVYPVKIFDKTYNLPVNHQKLVIKDYAKIKGVVFDLDGVITNTADLHHAAWTKMAQSIGIKSLTNETELRGVTRKEALEIILRNNQITNKFTDKQKEALTNLKNQIYLDSLTSLTQADILPNMKENLIFLKNHGYKLALASVSQNATTILDKLNLTNLFDYVVDAKTIKKHKPNSEIFAQAANGIGLNLNEVIVVDDSELGMLTTKKHHIKSIGITVDGTYSFNSTNELTTKKLEEILKENGSWH